MIDLETLGIPKGLAKKLAQDAARQEPDRALSSALKSLGEQIATPEQSAFMEGGMFAFIGPTGVGKTTTLAKIAAQAVLTHGRDSVALITTDRFRIGAQEQLRNYARILNIPLHVARDEQHLAELLPAVSSKRLVLIDTAGMSPRDLHMMNALKNLPAINERLNLLLVLSAQAQYSAMADAINRFQVLPLAGMILTKLDETVLLGSALAALIHGGLPLVCTGVGQRVPEDLWYPAAADLIKQAIELGQGELARAEAEYPGTSPFPGQSGRNFPCQVLLRPGPHFQAEIHAKPTCSRDCGDQRQRRRRENQCVGQSICRSGPTWAAGVVDGCRSRVWVMWMCCWG